MTTQLETAFARASLLPDQKQKEIADLILREVSTYYQALDVQAKALGVERRDANLYVKGTRITVYDLMDYIESGHPLDEIRDLFGFSQARMDAVMEFIRDNEELVESEYQQTVRNAEEHRRYWEERNRERMEWIRTQPPAPGQEAIYEKLRQLKLELGIT